MVYSSNITLENRSLDGDDQVLLMSSVAYAASAVTLFCIGFFGFFFNLSIIFLMWKNAQLRTPLNLILFNLVCSDFSVSILGTPWTLLSAISRKWIFGQTMCEFYGFFMSLLGISSITTLTVLAFERYVIVSQPFRNQGLSHHGAFYLILGIWMYSTILTTPPLLGWGKYVNEAANISCSVNWEEKSLNALTYIIYLFCFGLVIPLIVIIFSYTKIMQTMRKSRMKMGRVNKAEGQIAFMVFVMIVAFLVAWSPYAVSALVAQFGEIGVITPAMGVFPALLAKTSICYNPVIYFGLNSQFRQSLIQLFKKRDNPMDTCIVLASRCMSHDGRFKSVAPTTVFTEKGESHEHVEPFRVNLIKEASNKQTLN